MVAPVGLRRRGSARLRRHGNAVDGWLLGRLSGFSARTELSDLVLTTASRMANRSRLWLAVSAVLAGTGGRRGRRAAAHGLLGIAIASIAVNGPLKGVWQRPRPQIDLGPRRRVLPVPSSFSFPSGHSASAVAFATGVALESPAVALPVGAAAAVVAYSRIHAGVHYPSDVVVGAGVGVLAGVAAGRVLAVAAALGAPLLARAPDNGVPRRAVVLTSRRSGAAGGWKRARSAMIAAGFDIVEEIDVQHSARLAEWVGVPAGQLPLIVAAGGDGTVGAAADHVAGTGAILGVVPLGTSNDVARSLGIPIDPVRAVWLLATGKVSTIDTGLLKVAGGRGRHFVHAATVGVNVAFVRLATQVPLRRRVRRFAYVVAAARALHQREPFPCELHYDGKVDRFELIHLSAINAPVFGGFLDLRVKGAHLDDRLLDVIAIEHLPIHRLALAAVQWLVGRTASVRGIHTGRVSELRVESSRPLELALDGEIAGVLPAEFAVAGNALRVITPHEFEDNDD